MITIQLTGNKKENEEAFYTMLTNGNIRSTKEPDQFIISNELLDILNKKNHKFMMYAVLCK